MKGISLFSSAGIAETYLSQIGVDIVASNELLPDRARLHAHFHKKTKMINGNILNKDIFSQMQELVPKKLDFLIASPPCQGLSVAGKNRSLSEMLDDDRNHLIFRVIEFIKLKKPEFVLIENVPNFLKVELPYERKLYNLMDILSLIFKNSYNIEAEILNASDYGVPQRRNRAIIKLYKKGRKWGWPSKENPITVQESIGHLPSLESGQKSNLPWHFARKHSNEHILWMKHTPTGKSAFENETFFPKKKTGELIKSYNTTYRRIKWDEPAPTITIRNDAISSQMNVHPGRKLKNGTYSDARVLTPLELMLLSSLPADWEIPAATSELLLRKCIGECIPPLMVKKILLQINN